MRQRLCPRPRTAVLLAALGLAPALAPAPNATAQVAAGGGGRALDANQRAGSGRTNTLENQVDYRVRNELLTGNVGGVLGFQDDLGYSSSGAFQDALGSDDLFEFRTESIRSDVRRVNTPLGRGGAITAGNVVFSNFAAPEVSGFNRTTVVQNGGVFGVNRTAPNPAEAFAEGRGYSVVTGGTAVGVLSVPDGGALAVSVDPLRGVVRQPVRRRGASTDPVPGAPGTVGLPGTGARATAGFGPNQSGASSSRATGSDGLQLGQLQGIVSGQLQGTAAHGDPQTVRERVAQARERIFGEKPEAPADDTAAEPVDNAYTRLLERVKNRGQDQPNDTPETGVAPDGDDAVDVRPEWMQRLAEPPESRIEAAEKRMQERLERIRNGGQSEDEETGSESGGSTSAASEEAAADLDSLLNELDYDVRLETLVTEREGRTAELYQKAQTDLASGRFINAERTYRQLRLQDAANPLGRAGHIHAQLGAGMMRAAAFNLRGLFEAHPELIATRYDQQLLPPSDRMVWLQGELQRSIDEAGASGQAGLMMAYLGHQVESRQLVRYGLAVAREADPDDALLPLVERIWLDEPAGGGPQAPVSK